MRGRSHPVFPSPLVTVKEESIIISGGSGSLSADVSQTDSIISLSQPKEMGTSSVEWPKSSKLCSQLAALTIRTPDIESEYSQLTPRRLNNRKMELLKRLDILDKCIRQKTTSDNANQESVKQVEEEETVIGRLSFDESGSVRDCFPIFNCFTPLTSFGISG